MGLTESFYTSPVLVLRFEADTEDGLEGIKNIFYQNLKTITPNLKGF